jgi:hypothetical protein
MSGDIQRKSAFEMLRSIPTVYPREVQRFANHLEEKGLGLEEAGSFLESLDSETRIDRESRQEANSYD